MPRPPQPWPGPAIRAQGGGGTPAQGGALAGPPKGGAGPASQPPCRGERDRERRRGRARSGERERSLVGREERSLERRRSRGALLSPRSPFSALRPGSRRSRRSCSSLGGASTRRSACCEARTRSTARSPSCSRGARSSRSARRRGCSRARPPGSEAQGVRESLRIRVAPRQRRTRTKARARAARSGLRAQEEAEAPGAHLARHARPRGRVHRDARAHCPSRHHNSHPLGE